MDAGGLVGDEIMIGLVEERLEKPDADTRGYILDGFPRNAPQTEFFLENYDIAIARRLVQGVDVWLNNPIPPLEASGTSGMKAAVKGTPNLSILDGWWVEGYNGENGWAFGDGFQHPNPEVQRDYDARSLYELLESEIVHRLHTGFTPFSTGFIHNI